MPGLHPDRAPTIVAGALMLVEALRAFDLDSTEVSDHDILRGAALEAVHRARDAARRAPTRPVRDASAPRDPCPHRALRRAAAFRSRRHFC